MNNNSLKNVLNAYSSKKDKAIFVPENIVAVHAQSIEDFKLGSDKEFRLAITVDYLFDKKVYHKSTILPKKKYLLKADEFDITINAGQVLPDLRVIASRNLSEYFSDGLRIIVNHKTRPDIRDTLTFTLNTLEVRYEFVGKDGKDGSSALFPGRDARAADEGCDCKKESRSGRIGYDGENGENGATLSIYLTIKSDTLLKRELLYVAIKNHTTNHSEVHIVNHYCEIYVSTAAGSGGTGGNGSSGGDGLVVQNSSCSFSCSPSDGGDGGDAGIAGKITVYVDSSVTLKDLNFTAEIKRGLPGGGGDGGSGGSANDPREPNLRAAEGEKGETGKPDPSPVTEPEYIVQPVSDSVFEL